MAPAAKKPEKKGKSTINEVVTREYTIHMHKRIFGIGSKRRAPRAIKVMVAVPLISVADAGVGVGVFVMADDAAASCVVLSLLFLWQSSTTSINHCHRVHISIIEWNHRRKSSTMFFPKAPAPRNPRGVGRQRKKSKRLKCSFRSG